MAFQGQFTDNLKVIRKFWKLGTVDSRQRIKIKSTNEKTCSAYKSISLILLST